MMKNRGREGIKKPMNGHFLDTNDEFNICKHSQNKRTVVANFYPFITYVLRKFLLRLFRVIGVLPISPLDRPSRRAYINKYVQNSSWKIFLKILCIKNFSRIPWILQLEVTQSPSQASYHNLSHIYLFWILDSI